MGELAQVEFVAAVFPPVFHSHSPMGESNNKNCGLYGLSRLHRLYVHLLLY